MLLTPSMYQGERDHTQVQAFLQSRHAVNGQPDYWNSGMWKLGMYLTLFEGDRTDHQFWRDKTGIVHAYT